MPGTWADGVDAMLGAVAAAITGRRAQGWLVGGSVRDRELGRFSPDIDVAVTGDAAAIARQAARTLSLPWFTLSEEHRAYRIVGLNAHVDVAAVRGDAIESDLSQRDFTINAMALPLGADGRVGDLVDPYAGLTDLGARRLVAVSAGIFLDDPLRLMRAARFAHALDLCLDSALQGAIRDQAALIAKAAPERIATEMTLTFDAGRSGDAVRLWESLGLLRAVIPEAGGSEGEVGPEALLDRLEDLLVDPGRAFPEAATALGERLAAPVDGAMSRPTALRFAGLIRGAGSAAGEAGRRLRLSARMMSLLSTLARMSRSVDLPPVAGPPGGPGRAAVLFLWAAAPWEPEALLLAAAADAGATDPASDLMTLWARRCAADRPSLPIDGTELMAALGLEAGPRLGMALREAKLAWEAGEAGTIGQALEAARAALAER